MVTVITVISTHTSEPLDGVTSAFSARESTALWHTIVSGWVRTDTSTSTGYTIEKQPVKSEFDVMC